MERHSDYNQALLQSALNDLETRHALLFHSAPSAMFAFDVTTLQILAANNAAIAQYGYTRDELLVMKTRDLRTPESRDGLWRLEASLRAGHEVHAIVKHARRDGTPIDVEVHTSTLAVGNGRVRLALATDVTEQKRGNDAARLLDRASGILMASLDHKTICRNLAALVLPALGEWCIVHRVEDGHLTPCDFAHTNPLDEAVVGELFETRDVLPPTHPVMRAGQSGSVISGALVTTADAALNAHQSELHQRLGTTDLLCVPVLRGGNTVAVVECGRTVRSPAYGENTRALAMAMAERASLALDNAATYAALLERVSQPAATGEYGRDGSTSVLENIPDGYIHTDGEWTLTYANREAERVLGRPREDLVDRSFWTLFPTAVGSIFETQYRRAIAEQQPVTFEAYFGALDLWAEVNARPEGDGLAIFFRDITRHRHALARAEASEESYRDFLETATDLVHMIAPDGRVLFANRAWRETLGYSDDEVRTLNILDIVAPEYRQSARETLEQCLQGADLPEVEMVVLTKDGRRVVIRGHANCRFVDGHPVSTRAIYRDVTAQVETQQFLARAKRSEAASARAKTAFLDRMSHEMRTPLTAVIGFADLLEANRGERLSEKDVDFARRIGIQGRSLLAIVEDVLSYAEIESSRVDLIVAPLDVGQLVEEVCGLYRNMAAEAGVTLTCDVPLRGVLLQTDRAVLRRVLRYLLSDAVGKPGAERVLVTVHADASGGNSESITVETTLRDGSVVPALAADPSAALELGLSIGLSLAQVLGFELDVERRADDTLVRTLHLRSTHRADRRETGESAKTLHALLDASPLAIIAFDPDWTVRLWNKAAQNMFGYASAEAIEQRFNLLPPGDEPAFRELLRSALDQPHGVTEAPAVHLAKDGSRRDVILALAALRDSDGRLRGFLSIVTDVTERKRMEADLRQAQKMEVIGRLAGGIAHDFNNLLTVISAHSQFLMGDLSPDDERAADAHAIQDATERAAALTRQLLTFSRREAPQRRNVDLNQKLANTERLLRRILGSHIEFVTMPAATPVVVYADPGQMEQVLMNLVLNARDAMPHGGALVVEISAQVEAPDVLPRGEVHPAVGFAQITVSDTGTGMDAATQQRVFEPFFTTKAEGRGTGLGLSTVHDIVSQSGGTIAVESTVGRGTMFTIRLPLVQEATLLRVARDAAPTLRGTETILLVEDQEAVRAVAARVLRARGYTVLSARHGSDALDIVHRQGAQVHLLLTDLVMPEMPGTEVAVRVRAMAPHIRVLFMSGYSETPFSMSVNDEGIPLVRKPFTAEELSRAVRDTLDAVPGQTDSQ